MKQTNTKPSIAIIGSGITGLSAAWLLHKKYQVYLFEKNDYLGGHTHTHDVQENSEQLSIDSGFIVYNEKNYPNLVGLFNQLDVKTQATDMSFAFSLNSGELEYSGSGIAGMFAQRRNILSIKHWRLIQEIMRFNKVAHAELKNQTKKRLSIDVSLGDFLSNHGFSDDLQQHYLLPMGAAIWSSPVETMCDFPAYSFLRFFANHGLIDLQNRPQWRTVVGGSREYIKKMMVQMEDELILQGVAISVNRDSTGITVKGSEGSETKVDQVVFACHADEALALLDEPSDDEKNILSCFHYQENKTYLHTDESLMPTRKKAWSSWNYLATTDTNSKKQVTATYWMNHLQMLTAEKNYLVTLNPYQAIDEKKIIKNMIYHHPTFDKAAMSAQTQLHKIQGGNNSWFCGSYTGYGFHEDALSSSVEVCKQLGVRAPWVNP